MGILIEETSRSLTLVPALGTLFLLLGCHGQLQNDSFASCIFIFYSVMFGCCPLEACDFE